MRTLLAVLFATPLAAEDLPANFADLQSAAVVQAVEETQGHNDAFGMSTAKFSMGFDAGSLQLRWESPSGRVATAEGEIIGNFSPAGEAFVWAWGNETIPDALKPTALAIKSYAEARDLVELQEAQPGATLIYAERLAAIATLFPGVEGIYGTAWQGDQVIFLGFGPVEVTQP